MSSETDVQRDPTRLRGDSLVELRAVSLLPGGLHAALEQHPLGLLGAHLLLGLGREHLLRVLVPGGETGVWEEFRQIVSSSNFTRSGSGYATAARLIGEKNVVRVSTHATTLPMKKIATIATTMPMITKVGLDLSSAIILRC